MSAHCWGPVLICIHRWKRPRMRCRRLCTSSTDPKRPQGHLRAANGQDFTTSAAPLHGEFNARAGGSEEALKKKSMDLPPPNAVDAPFKKKQQP